MVSGGDHLLESLLDRRQLGLRHEVGLVEQDAVGEGHLRCVEVS